MKTQQDGLKTPYPSFVLDFFKEMDDNPDQYGEDIWNCRRNVIEKAFQTEELEVREDLAEKYFSLQSISSFKLLPFQKCALGLWGCVFKDHAPRWSTLFIMSGRGSGKDGIIAFASLMFTSPFNPVRKYDIDICAVNEEQAKRPVKDVTDWLIEHNQNGKMKKRYHWTKEQVTGLSNGGTIRGRPSNSKGRDGMRSGCVIFNEVHQYENEDNINVFTTGLGKVAHARSLYVTTNGFVSGGALDNKLEIIEPILTGEDENDGGWLPFLFRLKDEKDISDKSKWFQANFRLKYDKELYRRYEEDFKAYDKNHDLNTSFPTKRLNLRQEDKGTAVADPETLKAACNRPLIDLSGHSCIAGIDYASTNDWVSVNLHFVEGEERYDINHAWVCKQGSDYHKLKILDKLPTWQRDGWLTIVDEPDINAKTIAAWLVEQSKKYNIKRIVMDSFRWRYMEMALKDAGFSDSLLTRVRKSDIMKTEIIVNSCFLNNRFHWGGNKCLMWGASNTVRKRSTASKIAADGQADSGNFLYSKIDRYTRKNDMFMALVASICVEEELMGPVWTEENPGFSAFVF